MRIDHAPPATSDRSHRPHRALQRAGGLRQQRASGFDPSDLLDFLDTKKKLPGERKPVFPEGVPGLEQGVPKDLYKGSRQQQIDEQNAQAAAAAAAAGGAEVEARREIARASRPPAPRRR